MRTPFHRAVPVLEVAIAITPGGYLRCWGSGTLPIVSAPAGWYPDPALPATVRYWDGVQWTEHRAPAALAVAVRAPKDMAVAYVLAVFLGCLGIHNFYLGRVGPAVGQLVLTITVIGWLASLVWVIIDLFLIPGWVRAWNATAGTVQAVPR